jgi:dihydroorotate dehydrogenase
LVKPWLWLPPSVAHHAALSALDVFESVACKKAPEWAPFSWRGIQFPNRLGLAGGVDKNADHVRSWQHFGAGFIEVGTVTPKPQTQNDGKVIDRHVPTKSLWNRFGFPNKGSDYVANRLEKIAQQRQNGSGHSPIFLNIGKNRNTPNESAHLDYVHLIEKMNTLASAIVINISSPNTKDLRALLEKQNLKTFLTPVVKANTKKIPLLLKLTPDLTTEDLQNALSVSLDLGIDGWILTNTSATIRDGLPFVNDMGGVSGLALCARSREVLKETLNLLGKDRNDKLVISCGGISTSDEIKKRLDMGADLVQVYSSLVFEGPGFFRKIASEMVSKK